VVASRAQAWVGGLLIAGHLLTSSSAHAQSAPPAPRPDEQFDFMNLITQPGLHDIDNESWNAYGQLTWIQNGQLGFPAAYTNKNGSNSSLLTGPEWGYTVTLTLFTGARLWPGAEAYFVPELISERPFSGLKGLAGAIQDFELQKGGTETPSLYRSRAYVRQTIELGGERVVTPSNPMQLGTVYKRRRIVLTAGNFSVLDFFDQNAVLGDLRQSFFSLGFLTYAAWDFNSDARGYSFGGVVELYWDDWQARYARVTPPQNPNQLPVTFNLTDYFGDQLELVHQHKLWGRPGAVHLLGYMNHDWMGNFSQAIAAFEANPQENAANCPGGSLYGSTNATAPDLCWVRGPNYKMGLGVSLEQFITNDIGAFVRGMYSDGQTEVDAYTSADRSLSFGVVGKGSLWHRPKDVTGVGANLSWISAAHAQYLAMGGVDGFVGDGAITPATETATDVFYSVNLRSSFWLLSSIWLSGDYQHIINPGFNSARGPVDVFGARLHVEF